MAINGRNLKIRHEVSHSSDSTKRIPDTAEAATVGEAASGKIPGLAAEAS